ncbi:MAG: hypothetical protein WBG41_15065 [Acidimicrobiales bacterium]
MDDHDVEHLRATLAVVENECSEAFDRSERDSDVRRLAVAVYRLSQCLNYFVNDIEGASSEQSISTSSIPVKDPHCQCGLPR